MARKTMSEEIAARTFNALTVQKDGAIRPPGAGIARLFEERDGRQLLIVSRGDSFDVCHGRREPIVFSISPRTALSLAWWLIWSWWFVGTWCGLKTRLWSRALRRLTLPGRAA